MTFPLDDLLQKATLTTTDFGGAGEAPTSIQQVRQFIALMSAEQVMLPDVRTVTSNAAKWVESGIDFASRIARPGTEATRLLDADRVKPSTFPVEISTVLIRGEVPVSDEALENAAADDLAGNMQTLIADRFGFDIEDLFLNGDTGSGDTYLAQLMGWYKLAEGAGGNVVAASSFGQDYQAIFERLLISIPSRFKRNLRQNGRFYVPVIVEEKYREQLSQRGTALGDAMLQGELPLKYQGIEIRPVPAAGITAGTPDTCKILLAHKDNLYAGFRRRMTFESWRDPREGATSFVINARVAPALAVAGATAIATGVNCEP